MSLKAFKSLDEYSISVPTGQRIGKVWKKNLNWGTGLEPDWVICEYTDHPDPDLIGIDYRRIEIVEPTA